MEIGERVMGIRGIKPRDFTGLRFGRLTVVRVDQEKPYAKYRSVFWICLCDCGNECSANAGNLVKGQKLSCGCIGREKALPLVNVGDAFGRLIVIGFSTKGGRKSAVCKCQCGNEYVVRTTHLANGNMKSCGCLRTAILKQGFNYKHGYTSGRTVTPEFKTWANLRTRCRNPNRRDYCNYGGRGISVCDRWLHGDGIKGGFECFLADMGERPSVKHSIDRIDNDGNYEPGNVRWATREEQNRNTRYSRKIKFQGRLMPLGEAAELSGVNMRTLSTRLGRGWSHERALDPRDHRLIISEMRKP